MSDIRQKSNFDPKIHRWRIHGKPASVEGAALAFFLIAGAAYCAPALAVAQDTPTRIDGVRAVCTGVGESKDDPRWNAYPLKLVFANTKGQYTAGEKIDVTRNGQAMMQTSCDAPWLLLRSAPGNYRVTATLSGPGGERHASADFSTLRNGAQKTVTLDFPLARSG